MMTFRQCLGTVFTFRFGKSAAVCVLYVGPAATALGVLMWWTSRRPASGWAAVF